MQLFIAQNQRLKIEIYTFLNWVCLCTLGYSDFYNQLKKLNMFIKNVSEFIMHFYRQINYPIFASNFQIDFKNTKVEAQMLSNISLKLVKATGEEYL
jgi:hypothetical protein